MDHIEIVNKLIGSIHPAGDSQLDKHRFENLKVMCNLVQRLVEQIDDVACQKDRQENSIRVMGNYAHDFLTKTVGIVE